MDGQKPDRERQLGGMEDRPRRERHLVLAAVALNQLALGQPGSAIMAAGRADKALGPAQLLDHGSALLLGAECLAERRLAQALDPRRQLDRHSRASHSPEAAAILAKSRMTLEVNQDEECV